MSVKIIRKFPDSEHPRFSFPEWDKQFTRHNVIINARSSDVYYPLHWTCLSVKCAFMGSEYYEVNRMRYSVCDNNYLILNDGTMYESYIHSEKTVESLTFNFTKEFHQEVYGSLVHKLNELVEYNSKCDNPGFFEMLYSHNELSENIINRIRREINKTEQDHLELNELMHALLGIIITEQNSSIRKSFSGEEMKYSTRIELYKRLNRAKDHLFSNYNSNIDLNELGKVSLLSPHYLLRKFKKYFGVTPHKYLMLRRLDAAKEMLTRTGLSVTEICHSVGFESLSSFGVLYKKHFGASPENFRNNIFH